MKRRLLDKTCKFCGKTFRTRLETSVYCNRRCQNTHLNSFGRATGKKWVIAPEKCKNMSRGSGEENHFWIGDKVGYRGLHNWIEKERGKPHYCEHCKKDKLAHRQYHWANVSGEYRRDVSDWIRLCVKCHKKYDK